jgi:hypothetical protein
MMIIANGLKLTRSISDMERATGNIKAAVAALLIRLVITMVPREHDRECDSRTAAAYRRAELGNPSRQAAPRDRRLQAECRPQYRDRFPLNAAPSILARETAGEQHAEGGQQSRVQHADDPGGGQSNHDYGNGRGDDRPVQALHLVAFPCLGDEERAGPTDRPAPRYSRRRSARGDAGRGR